MRRLLPLIASLFCLNTARSNEHLSAKRDYISQAIRQDLPRYNAEQSHARAPAERDGTPARTAEQVKPGHALTDGKMANEQTSGSVIQLEPMVIRPKPESRARLPRVTVPPPIREIKAVPFESDAARDERLVQKHLSRLDQVLNGRLPWLKQSLIQRARSAEARESRALLLNEIAFLLELGALADGDDAQASELLREYKRLYHTRPE